MKYLSGIAAVCCLFVSALFAGSSDELVYSYPKELGSLNPHTYKSQMFAQDMVFEGLVKYEEGKVKPRLATSWDVSDGGKTITFTLRKNVVFSDGTPFDANAAKMNLDSVKANNERHKWLELINQIQNIEAPDSHTLIVRLKDAYYPALQELALIRPIRFLSPSAFPESKDTLKDGIKKAVGTGPWKLVKSVRSEYYLFERNENYWGEKPDLKRIKVLIVADANTRVVAFETGDIDLIYGASGHGGGQISLNAFKEMAKDSRFVTGKSDPLNTRAIALNSNRGATREKAVRQAILHAVDRQLVADIVYQGAERPADFLFSEALPYCDVGLIPYAFDQKKSKALLDDAGWKKNSDGTRSKNGRKLEMKIYYISQSPDQKATSEMLQAVLSEIGITLNIHAEESDSFYKRQKSGEFDLIFGETWGPPYDPHSFMSSMRVPSHADYQAQLGLSQKAEIDRRIGQVLTEPDVEKRQAQYKWLLRTLHEEAVYLTLTYGNSVLVHRPTLKGVKAASMSNVVPFESMSKE